ncbi:hypothetical protein OIDMADRAFT_52857 [Oidiodendron maius Zn]|uniref:BZIP domain-containing protein n=1 Tax=Oidiodendron maius (strain Zn) TaxID=913774 RepID=A0A0C3DLY8_OIDMZ|nr:hypothetical protein OIDMADRAFT_52857 [Oidiodendron maius Zn]
MEVSNGVLRGSNALLQIPPNPETAILIKNGHLAARGMEAYNLDSTQNSPGPWEVPVMESHDSDAANDVSDSIERRRMQNRLAQRNHRKRVRAHISALEQRVVENILSAAPKETSVPTPSTENTIPPTSLAQSSSLSPLTSTSLPSQYPALATSIGSVASQSNLGIEDMLHFMEFPQTAEDTCSSHAATSQGWVPTSTSSYAATLPRCTACYDMVQPYTTNTIKESCCKVYSELSPPYNRHVYSPLWQDAGMYGYGGEARANPGDLSIPHPHRPPALRPQMSTTQQHFNIPQSTHIPSISYCHNPRLHSWGPPVSLRPEHMSMRMSTYLFLMSASGSTVDIVCLRYRLSIGQVVDHADC